MKEVFVCTCGWPMATFGEKPSGRIARAIVENVLRSQGLL